jgi:GMP synthase (glutamine-hydrolysing)
VVRIAIIQFRLNKIVEVQEQKHFLSKIDLENIELTFFNGLERDVNNISLDEFDAFIFGGSSDVSLIANGKNTENMRKNSEKLIKKIFDQDKLSLFICLGHQFVAIINGEVLVHKPEVTTIKITLNENGKNDPIFKNMPECFFVQTGHNDSLITMPKGATALANPCHEIQQVLKYKNKIYTVQFHPEQNKQDFLERLEVYKDKYIPQIGLKKSPVAKLMIRNFLKLV